MVVSTVDGNEYSGVFHTATPFAGKSYHVAIKAARPSPRNTSAGSFCPSPTLY